MGLGSTTTTDWPKKKKPVRRAGVELETRLATRPQFVANVMHIVTGVAISAGICEKLTSGVEGGGGPAMQMPLGAKQKRERSMHSLAHSQQFAHSLVCLCAAIALLPQHHLNSSAPM